MGDEYSHHLKTSLKSEEKKEEGISAKEEQRWESWQKTRKDSRYWEKIALKQKE